MSHKSKRRGRSFKYEAPDVVWILGPNMLLSTKMRSDLVIVLAVLAVLASSTAASTVYVRDAEEVAQTQIIAMSRQASEKVLAALNTKGTPAASNSSASSSGGCTLKTLRFRREWGSMSAVERTSYLDAVLCLQRLPAKTPSSAVPGAKTRFDDFVAAHMNQTMSIHYTGNFLGWHRYFTWLYENALHEECGYNGTQPYWDWGLSATSGMSKSPVFDGSNTSFSGDGQPVANQSQVAFGGQGGLPIIYFDSGTGGGCVTSGPFVNMSVNLGPVTLPVAGNRTEHAADPTAHNPRCLKRSLSDGMLRQFATSSRLLELLTNTSTMDDFQMIMQGIPGTGQLGVHGGAHMSLGGDPSRDFFISNGDPVFYAHHAMIDRVWWMWQWQDQALRMDALAGTRTFLNTPPGPNTTLDDELSYGYLGGSTRKMRDVMSTTAGPFCYIYL